MKEDKVIGIFLVIFSIFMYVQAEKLPEGIFGTLGAGFFPKILFAILGISGVVLTAGTIFREKRYLKKEGSSVQEKKTATFIQRVWERIDYHQYVLLAFLAFFVYVLLMYYAGYLLSTAFFMLVLMWILGPRTKKSAVVIVLTTFAVTFGIYFSFLKLLDVFLPSGTLF